MPCERPLVAEYIVAENIVKHFAVGQHSAEMPAACQIDILSRSRADSILSAVGDMCAFLPMGEVGNLIPIVKALGVVTGAIEMPAVERGTCACHRHLVTSVRSIY